MQAVNIMMRAGTADITPREPCPLFGRVGRAGNASEQVSALEASCLMMETEQGFAAIITIDSLYPSQKLEDAVRKSCAQGGLQFEQGALIFVASHTHNAPALDPTKPKLGEVSEDYCDLAAGQIADCILAMRNEQGWSASLKFGSSQCRASIFRRKRLIGFDMLNMGFRKKVIMAPNRAVPIDQTMKIALIEDRDRSPRALIWSWPCHAVSEPQALSVSADFPGVARDHIRKRLGAPDLPVFYFPGFSGDIRPASSSPIPLHKSGSWLGFGSRFGKNSATAADSLQKQVNTAVDKALMQAHDAGSLDGSQVHRTRKTLNMREIRSQSNGLAPLTCDSWSIGPLAIKAVSSEIANGYSQGAGNEDPMTFVTGCAGQVMGYIPMDQQIAEGGYEAGGFAQSFSVAGEFHPHIEAQIAQLIGQ